MLEQKSHLFPVQCLKSHDVIVLQINDSLAKIIVKWNIFNSWV